MPVVNAWLEAMPKIATAGLDRSIPSSASSKSGQPSAMENAAKGRAIWRIAPARSCSAERGPSKSLGVTCEILLYIDGSAYLP